MPSGDFGQSAIVNLQSSISPSPGRAFWALVAHSTARHWRVRQIGWVAVALLGLTVVWVSLVSASPAGWRLEDRRARRGGTATYKEFAAELLPSARYAPWAANRPTYAVESPTPFDPTRDALAGLLLSVPHAVLSSETFRRNWEVMNFSRWAVGGGFFGFVLPLFTLAYASGAIGGEREGRSLIWLLTRPLPRAAIYLAKFVGAVPWCLVFAGGGFVAVCLAGGEPGRAALRLYWPAAAGGAVAYAAVFHLLGAVTRRPVVAGMVYVFFYEQLLASLPGSLKLLSLSFHARSLMYSEAEAAGLPAGMLDVYQPVAPGTAWAVLAAVTVGATGLGMWLFSRAEFRDEGG